MLSDFNLQIHLETILLMKRKIGVQELDAKEIQETDGGFFSTLLGVSSICNNRCRRTSK